MSFYVSFLFIEKDGCLDFKVKLNVGFEVKEEIRIFIIGWNFKDGGYKLMNMNRFGREYCIKRIKEWVKEY